MLISQLSRKRLASLPTPLHPLPRFAEALGAENIWIKRDDLTALGLGGNKARKLEFLVGDALQKDCDVLITTGGVQSNHARMTAAAAAVVGLDCVLVLTGEEPPLPSGNLLLDTLFGAQVIFCPEEEAPERMESVARDRRERGSRPYIVPLGGSVPVGCVGYVLGGFELMGQTVDADLDFGHIVMASGSAGTAAGLALALARMEAPVTLHTVSVSRCADQLRDMTRELIVDTSRLLGWDPGRATEIFRVHDGYVGGGYTVPTDEGVEAIKLLADTEAIVTDPTYTGKALAALVDLLRRGEIPRDEGVVFLHTGGFPANFARPEILLDHNWKR